MPCLWFLEFVERQVLRRCRTVVLGRTPLSQKPIPRPDAHYISLYITKTMCALAANVYVVCTCVTASGKSRPPWSRLFRTRRATPNLGCVWLLRFSLQPSRSSPIRELEEVF
ncbi:uncharacterized protein TM35_000301670, partial [Trypanosoma theileri]